MLSLQRRKDFPPTAREPFYNQQFVIIHLKELSQFSSSQNTSEVLQPDGE